MSKSRIISLLALSGLVVGLFQTPTPAADAEIAKKSIGGRWYVTDGEPPTYLYRDGQRYVDLFSYHRQDSNKDGIDNLRISHDASFVIIRSQGYPNHPTALFPNSGNPNSIRVQDFTFRLPLEPRLAESVTRVPMGPIGMALNGVAFFNPFEIGGMNAVEGYSEVWLDSCCGHPQQEGVYHYHKYPSCVKSPFPDDGKQHSPIIGFAWDGFPVYGPYGKEGVMAKDLKEESALDVCNGHADPERGYHYHVTPGRFPYLIGGYAGVPERSNSRELSRGGQRGAIVDNARGQSPIDGAIVAIRPGTASRGGQRELTLELAAQHGGRGGSSQSRPSWVQIGPYEATRVERKGNKITFEIDIPADANVGVLLDCHVEFGGHPTRGGSLVIKKNDAFRVVE
ncbi:MAG: YHYH protein [Planctomycetia bacterium]|nr:YHYH protein [Planctomycetia bacterium]